MDARVLLAANSITLQEIVPQKLALGEAEVIYAGDGVSARQLINDIGPDLLIAEVSLEGVTGYELCEYVRENSGSRQMPIILLDEQFESFNQAHAAKVGADVYLAKPFENSKLVEIVDRLVQREREHESDTAPYDYDHEPAGLADRQEPREAQQDARAEGAPAFKSMTRRPPVQPRRGSHRQALLWAVLLGLMLASLALIISQSLPAGNDVANVEQENAPAPDSNPGASAAEQTRLPSSSPAIESSMVMGFSPEHRAVPVENKGARETVQQDDLVSNPPGAAGATPGVSQAPRQNAADNPPKPQDDSETARANIGRSSSPSAQASRNGGTSRRPVIARNARGVRYEMKKAGKHFGSGFKHVGMASKDSVEWSGKKAGKGLKKVGKAMKGLFD